MVNLQNFIKGWCWVVQVCNGTVFSTEHRYIELFLNSTASGAQTSKFPFRPWNPSGLSQVAAFMWDIYTFSFLSGRSERYYGSTGGSRSSGLRGAYWRPHPSSDPFWCLLAPFEATFTQLIPNRKTKGKLLFVFVFQLLVFFQTSPTTGLSDVSAAAPFPHYTWKTRQTNLPHSFRSLEPSNWIVFSYHLRHCTTIFLKSKFRFFLNKLLRKTVFFL